MDINELKKITTEQRNPATLEIDKVDTIDILLMMNEEDKRIPKYVERCLGQICFVVDEVVNCFKKGGRLIYIGAGTSGRIGLMDAVECYPTFSCDPEMVQALMAGGEKAMVHAVEGAEDDKQMAINQLKEINLNSNDCVIGIAASGRTPYTVAAVEYANEVGATSCCITTSINSVLAEVSKFPIECITGPEVVMGSTRLKSGTAQKIICNMITTASMIQMGRVYSNLLIDMKATNQKVSERCKNVLMEAIDVSYEDASSMLEKYGSIKYSIFSYLTGITNLEEIKEIFAKNYESLKDSLAFVGVKR